MASKTTEVIKVKNLSKFGFQTDSGEYINWSIKLSESDKGKVIPGGEYEFVLYVSDKGKRYVNEVKALTAVPLKAAKPELKLPVPPPAAVMEKAKALANKVLDDHMSKDEWASKDRRISRQGCIQVAVQVMSDFDEAAKLADKMLKYVND